MRQQTATLIIGGVIVGTVAVGVVSAMSWSVIPIGIWTMSVTAAGNASTTVMRLMTGQLWAPLHQMVQSKGR